jgi:molybdenum cofactor cytidylyltransferase
LINKVETADQLAIARRVARSVLLEERIQRVVIGAVGTNHPVGEIHRRVTAVVLAAGESERMGRTKQLLPWGQTTVLGQTLANLQASAVYETLVVTGDQAEAVSAIAAEANLPTIHNPDYASGEMLSSLQTALRTLPANRSAVLVVLADQPMVTAETIDHVLEAYWKGEHEIIAPSYEGKRGNPVLIGRPYFDELLKLPTGSAPRELLRRYAEAIQLVNVATNSVLLDLDSPAQYERWRPKA